MFTAESAENAEPFLTTEVTETIETIQSFTRAKLCGLGDLCGKTLWTETFPPGAGYKKV